MGVILYMFFFFFKQKPAYEIMPSLVGSEFCLGARQEVEGCTAKSWLSVGERTRGPCRQDRWRNESCPLKTSDAAEEGLGVDLGGRRYI